MFASQEDFEWHYKPVVGDSADQDSRNHGEARNEENGIVRKKTWTTMGLEATEENQRRRNATRKPLGLGDFQNDADTSGEVKVGQAASVAQADAFRANYRDRTPGLARRRRRARQAYSRPRDTGLPSARRHELTCFARAHSRWLLAAILGRHDLKLSDPWNTKNGSPRGGQIGTRPY